MKCLFAVVFVLVNLFVIAGCTEVERTVAPEEEQEAAEGEDSSPVIYKEGIYLVNLCIEPGRYRSEGFVKYFSILSGMEGALIARGLEYQLSEDELDYIVRNAMPGDRSFVIDIDSSDYAFETMGDGHWRLIDESYQPEVRTTFTEGTWIVGLEIEPGTYHTSDQVYYWARLSGFRDTFADAIDEELGRLDESPDEEGTTVVIQHTDVGFFSMSSNWEEGIIWKKVD